MNDISEGDLKIILLVRVLIISILIVTGVIAIIYPAFGNFVLVCLTIHLIRIFLED